MKTKDSFFVFQKVIFKSPPLLKIEFKKSLKRTPQKFGSFMLLHK